MHPLVAAKVEAIEAEYGKPLQSIFEEAAETKSFTATMIELGLSPGTMRQYQHLFVKMQGKNPGVATANHVNANRYDINGNEDAEGKTLKEWGEELGMPASTLNYRRRAGIPFTKPVSKPEKEENRYDTKLWNLVFFGKLKDEVTGWKQS